MTTMTCPACGHTADFEGEPHREILHCTECRARISWGTLMPRVVIEPHHDRRFVILRMFTPGKHPSDIVDWVLDKEFAFRVAREIASITAPPKTETLAHPLASEAAQPARAGLGP